MAGPGPGPRVATKDDVADVVTILVSAFDADPVWSWAFPDSARRPVQHGRWWGMFVEGAIRYPWVWLAAGSTATSVWVPPGRTELSDEQEAAVEPLLAELLGAGASRVLQALDMFESNHPRMAPHFYLSLLGTRAESRGGGHGLGLLAENLRVIDEARMPAYLEASNPVNVALYERHGFVVRGAFTLPDAGPQVVTMWRDASP